MDGEHRAPNNKVIPLGANLPPRTNTESDGVRRIGRIGRCQPNRRSGLRTRETAMTTTIRLPGLPSAGKSSPAELPARRVLR